MNNQVKKYYKVRVERGHMGSGHTLETTFYFEAYNAYDAMIRAQRMPSVKHTNVPLKVEEISRETYMLEYGNNRQSAYHTDKTDYYKSSGRCH